MSLRNNRAAKLNRYMMFGMFFLGIIVLGCVFAFLYLSYNKTDNPFVQQPQEENSVSDSIVILVNDSTLLTN
jgi:hypothetical protein